MTAAGWIVAGASFAVAAALALISARSFAGRGFLLNNAYLYASREEREKMDKRPYYLQTAIVFLLLSLVFAVIGLSVVLGDSRISLLEIPLILGAVIYAAVSTGRISRKAGAQGDSGAGR